DVMSNPLVRMPADLSRWSALRRLVIAATQLPAAELARVRAALPNVEIVGEPAKPAQPYSTKTKFAVDDRIAHPTFRIGEVRSLLPDNKIEVVFDDGAKTLLHNRK